MECVFCKSNLDAGALDCSNCGAKKKTLGAARVARLSPFGNLIYMAVWCNTIGLVWIIYLFGSFAPLYHVIVKENALFELREWRCMLPITARSISAPTGEFSAGLDISLGKGYFFRPLEFVPAPYSRWLHPTPPKCPEKELMAQAQEKARAMVSNAKAKGIKLDVRIADAVKLAELDRYQLHSRDGKQIKVYPITWRDYLAALIWCGVVLAVGYPILLVVNWLWRSIFGDSNRSVWVK